MLSVDTWRYSENGVTTCATGQTASGYVVGNSDSKSKLQFPNHRFYESIHKSTTLDYYRVKTNMDPAEVSAVGLVYDFAKKTYVPFTLGGTVSWLGSPSAIPYSALVDEARIEAHANFFEAANGDATGLVILGELKETIQMLKHPFQSLVDLTGGFYRSLPRRRNKSFHKALHDSYLEWTFGVSPLLADIADLTVATNSILDGIQYKRDRGYSKKTSTTLSSVSSKSVGHFNFRYQVKQTASVEVNIVGGRRVHVDYLSKLSAAYGINFHSVPSTIWELLPYSFVVDYVTNFGDIISAISGTGQEHYYLSRSELIKQKNEIVCLGTPTFSVACVRKNGSGQATQMTERTQFTRSGNLISGFNLLTPFFTLPKAKQFVNLAALTDAYLYRKSRHTT